MSKDVPRILIVTTRVDIATDYVVQRLSEMGVAFYRVNTEDFPLNIHSSLYIDTERLNIDWRRDDGPDHAPDLTNIRSVWYRRHRLPQMPATVDEAHAEYCLRESEWFIKGLVLSINRSTDVSWMSHPANVQIAESKIYQLTVAKSVGFTIPDTLISNDAIEVRRFFETKQGRIVAKPLRLGYFDYGSKQTSVYTNEVHWEHLGDDRSLQIAPVIYQ